jgi:glutaredoxin
VKNITMYSKIDCVQCDQAKELFSNYDVELNVEYVGEDITREQLLDIVPNARSVPQIFIDGKYVGGLAELKTYIKEGV